KGKGALERACACARNIERGHSAVRSAQDTVKHIVRVKRSCRDRPCGVETIDGKNNGALAGACARVRSIKCSDGAVRSAQEAVTYIARVNVASRDRIRRVDVAGAGTLAGACACARGIECGDGRLRANKGRVTEIQEAIARAAGGSGCEDTQQQDRGYGGS